VHPLKSRAQLAASRAADQREFGWHAVEDELSVGSIVRIVGDLVGSVVERVRLREVARDLGDVDIGVRAVVADRGRPKLVRSGDVVLRVELRARISSRNCGFGSFGGGPPFRNARRNARASGVVLRIVKADVLVLPTTGLSRRRW
jgi:hypothetical protein